jgi:serine/threonine protein kinase
MPEQASAPIRHPLNEGLVIDGHGENRYRIERLVYPNPFQPGTQGIVYLASQLNGPLERQVILKFSPDVSARDQRKLYEEARRLSHLNHRNICTVLDFEPDLGCIVLQYIEGRSVYEIVVSPDKKIPILDALDIAIQTCSGLVKAHQLRVCHLDLHWRNVMVDNETGDAIILDFGLAGTERVGGIPPFMPPERLRGERGGETVDVYSLGVMLFRMVSGEMPFHSRDHLHLDPASLDDLLRGDAGILRLDGILRPVLSPDPSQRPSANQLKSQLEELRRMLRETATQLPDLVFFDASSLVCNMVDGTEAPSERAKLTFQATYGRRTTSMEVLKELVVELAPRFYEAALDISDDRLKRSLFAIYEDFRKKRREQTRPSWHDLESSERDRVCRLVAPFVFAQLGNLATRGGFKQQPHSDKLTNAQALVPRLLENRNHLKLRDAFMIAEASGERAKEFCSADLRLQDPGFKEAFTGALEQAGINLNSVL